LDINQETDPQRLAEAVPLWSLALAWPAGDLDARVRGVVEFLESSSVIAEVGGGIEVPIGGRADVVIATSQGRVLQYDEDGRIAPGLDPGSFVTELAEATGSWILDPDPSDDGRTHEYLAGDRDGFMHAVQAAGVGLDALDSVTKVAVHQGEADPDVFQAVVNTLDRPAARILLHQDTAVFTEGAAHAASAITERPSDPRAALTLEDQGGWVRLSWFSGETLSAGAEGPRRPDVDVSVGRPSPTIAGLSVLEQNTPAARVQQVLRRFTPVASQEDVARLAAGGMSTTRAEQSALALSDTVTTGLSAGGSLAAQPWLSDLRDAVEMLGFDPIVVDVLAGTRTLPEPVETLTATSGREESAMPDDASQAGAGVARVPGADGPDGPARQAPTERRAGTNAVYVVVIVEMVIGAVFLFLKPLPWSWANLVVAAIAIAAGVIQLGRRELRR
jgi:hypothetical protein